MRPVRAGWRAGGYGTGAGQRMHPLCAEGVVLASCTCRLCFRIMRILPTHIREEEIIQLLYPLHVRRLVRHELQALRACKQSEHAVDEVHVCACAYPLAWVRPPPRAGLTTRSLVTFKTTLPSVCRYFNV